MVSPRAARPKTSVSAASSTAPGASSARMPRTKRAPSNRMVSCGIHSSAAPASSTMLVSTRVSGPRLR